MDLWAIVATGAVGLLAGQAGAWLQGRRDAAADQRRHGAEIERLNLQLIDARDQQARERAQRDTLEWRERRLSTYQIASSAYQAVSKSSIDLMYLDDHAAIATAITRMREGSKILEEQLEQCALISARETRHKALRLGITLEDLLSATEQYERRVVAMVAHPAEGPLMLAAIIEERKSRRGTDESVLPHIEYVGMAKLADEFQRADEEFTLAGDDWIAAARAELGVPD
ncbi:hypothetical protein [Kribbella sp. VKM Ac-2566]|uniref:hypothetical protein n=1 Tax=Kribbella sp. VKM Ac-2566 TaxID=2512218 RepID=UPI001064297E|nr:hypothetical protein [Kribbella sp. VKM Ac-2566]TDW88793.1 hypothetical protein EV647_5803 [Kribbella sp. VKM Ac-2566]